MGWIAEGSPKWWWNEQAFSVTIDDDVEIIILEIQGREVSLCINVLESKAVPREAMYRRNHGDQANYMHGL